MNHDTLALTPDQARFIHEVLTTPNLSLPLTDTKKLRVAAETREAIEDFVKEHEPKS